MWQNGNYFAFYVSELFSYLALGAHATKDFCYYNMLRAWEVADSTFPFNDFRDKTYSVHDGRDWERTLKPSLRQRLNNSKNIILFLSSSTKSSKALNEEIDDRIHTLGLPVIVIYPEYKDKESFLTPGEFLNSSVKSL